MCTPYSALGPEGSTGWCSESGAMAALFEYLNNSLHGVGPDQGNFVGLIHIATHFEDLVDELVPTSSGEGGVLTVSRWPSHF